MALLQNESCIPSQIAIAKSRVAIFILSKIVITIIPKLSDMLNNCVTNPFMNLLVLTIPLFILFSNLWLGGQILALRIPHSYQGLGMPP